MATIFYVSGTSLVIPSDYNSAVNTWEAIGGGGGASYGGGAGGGEYRKITNRAYTSSATRTIQIGAGGVGATTNGNAGTAGTFTQLLADDNSTVVLKANGGAGVAYATLAGGAGGTGGTGTTGFAGGNGGTSGTGGPGGGGGGGAGGPSGAGAAGGNTTQSVSTISAGGGGGGANGGSAGAAVINSTVNGGTGGGTGGGAGGTSSLTVPTDGAAATAGNGGGGGGGGCVLSTGSASVSVRKGGAGATGSIWTQTSNSAVAGPGGGGGGGGGGGNQVNTNGGGGAGALYGGGGGANGNFNTGTVLGGNGGQGILVLTYTPATASLPVTVSGLSTAVAPVGPFKVPAGTYSVAGAIAITGTFASSAGITGASSTTAIGQSFTNGASALTIPSIVVGFVAATGTPTGNVWAEITSTDYAGTVLATSTAVAAPTAAGDVTFTFSTPPTISASATFGIVFRRTVVDAVNYVRIKSSTTSLYAGGQYANYNGSTWTGSGTTDLGITVNGTATTASDAYYFFGRDSTTATTLQAYKSAAPDTSWGAPVNKTGFTTAILNIAACQVSNVIHLVVQDGTMSSSVATKYLSFDAATDTFLATIETVGAAAAITGQSVAGWGAGVTVRSNGNAVSFYNGLQTNTSGTARARVYYRERTGLNTYGTATQVDANTTAENTNPIVVLGASNRLHFLWYAGGNATQRHLTSGNALGTAAAIIGSPPLDVVTFDDSGTIRHVGLTAIGDFRWASADNPTVTGASITFGTPARGVDESGNVYALYQSSADSDLYVKSSTDDGATFGTAVSALVGTVAAADTNLSKNQICYQRGTNYVFPYVVNDNGTLKYNEYIIRSAGLTNPTMTADAGTVALSGRTAVLNTAMPVSQGTLTPAGQATALLTTRKTVAGLGTLTAAGQDATLTKSTVAVHRTMPADAGTLTLAGQVTALRATRKIVAGLGTLTLAGQIAVLRNARTATAGLGTLTMSGQTVVPRVTMPVTVSTLILAGQTVNLKRSYVMPVTVGTLTLAGQNAVLSEKNSFGLIASHGVLTLAGQDAALRSVRKLVAGQGTLTLAGQTAVLRSVRKLVAGQGTLTLAGQTATLKRNYVMPAGTGALALSGRAVTLKRNYVMPVTLGTLTSAGQAVNTIYSGAGAKLLPAGLGTLAASGQAVTLRCTRVVRPDTGGVTPWTPAALTTLKLWLKADTIAGSTGDPVSTWPDASGAGNDATQTGIVRPTLHVAHQNGLNTVKFGSPNGQHFDLPNAFTAYTEGAVAFVGRNLADPGGAGSSDHGLFHFGSDTLRNHYPYGGDSNIYDDFASTVRKLVGNPTPSLAAYHIGGFRSKASDWSYFLNGTQFYNTTTNTVGWRTDPSIGNTNGQGDTFDGWIGEVVLLNEFASVSDWQKIEGYLAWKWDTVATLDAAHPYKGVAPTIGTGGSGATITLAGQDVTLTKSTAATHYSMPAASGTLTLAGRDVTLTKTGAVTHRTLAAGLGALTLDGQPVIIRYAHRMAAGVGVLTVSGQTVTLNTTAPATFSTLTLSGRDVTLRKINKIRMLADAGTLTLAGQVLTLRRSRVPMAAALGTLTLSGRPVTLPRGRMLAAEVGSIVLAGKAASLGYREQARMFAEPGVLQLVGQDVILSKTTAPPVIRHETLRFGRSVYVSRW